MKGAIWQNWTNFLLGVWLVLTPWAFNNNIMNLAHMTNDSVASVVSWNYWIVGAAIAVAAWLAVEDLKSWEDWMTLVLGVWLFLTPWIFGYSAEPYLKWNSLIIGAVVAIFSAISLPTASRPRYNS